jgi:ABC-type enterobactin transport system permease subunit
VAGQARQPESCLAQRHRAIQFSARRWRAGRHALAALELLTGAVPLAGGVLRVFTPGGSLLRADPNAPAGTPFSDWRLPGVLLAVLVGAGFRLTGSCQRRNYRFARGSSAIAGARLVGFETAGLAWIGASRSMRYSQLSGVITVSITWRTEWTQP